VLLRLDPGAAHCECPPPVGVFGTGGGLTSAFELVFSLFGLLLGLAIAEVLGGFGRAVKARARLRIGWLTPLLGVIVVLDLISFWTIAWSLREVIPFNALSLMLLLVYTGIYYLAANLVFPEDPDRCPDFDDHYWANKKLVLGAVFLLNLPNYVSEWLAIGERPYNMTVDLATFTAFLLLVAAAAIVKGKRLNLVLLALIIALYPLNAIGVLL
jgi:hypothetical protein